MSRRRKLTGSFPILCSPEHLAAAIERTTRGKRRRGDVAAFLVDRERHESELAAKLRAQCWRPSPPRLMFLRDPKPRLIARASVGDRVVHTAVAMLLEPSILRSASAADFACRTGKGTHRAQLALMRGMQGFRHVLHLDIRSYFPSIQPELVMGLLRERVDDDAFLAVVATILEAGRGMYDDPDVRRYARIDPTWPPPGRGLSMGSVTSQLFATHLYLQAFDHWIQREQKVRGYVRYVDDVFLFSDSRVRLRELRLVVAAWLLEERSLRLKHPRAPLLSCGGTLDALGARISRRGIAPLPRAMRALRATVWDWVRQRGSARGVGEIERAVASRVGLLFRF